MSDLISRSVILQEIKDWQGDIHDNETDAIKYDFVFDRIYEILDEQPTAYDIDKVVKELETKKQNALEVEESIKEYNVWKDAIEIVKQGGVSDDVCEWKFEETNGIAWHCDDKCTTYNQVYIKDLKITLEDFECKCPFCGKKIKVVE